MRTHQSLHLSSRLLYRDFCSCHQASCALEMRAGGLQVCEHTSRYTFPAGYFTATFARATRLLVHWRCVQEGSSGLVAVATVAPVAATRAGDFRGGCVRGKSGRGRRRGECFLFVLSVLLHYCSGITARTAQIDGLCCCVVVLRALRSKYCLQCQVFTHF